MNIALVGFGVEGRASYDYFTRLGHTVTICDRDDSLQVPGGAETRLGPNYLQDLGRFDLIVRSAGIHPGILEVDNAGIAPQITTAVNEFLAACPTKNVVGVTGTKGKGTTSTLITKMLEAANKRVYLGGNIGRSPLEFVTELTPDDWVVLELSSFQLSDIKHSPHIGVCVMVVPEHLNWHTDMEDYKHAKANLFRFQNSNDIAIYNAQNGNSYEIAQISPGIKIPYLAPPGAYVDGTKIVIEDAAICDVSELKLLGKHNWENVCAAVTAVWQAAQDVQAIRSVLTSFTGLPHRLEFVRELDGVRYYDDSFGTTPETAIVALQAFAQPKVVILGGSDKGARYDALAETVAKGNVRSAIVIGYTGPAIAEALHQKGFTNVINGGSTMHEIVAQARLQAQPGDVVLLSTGCASFGLFKDYKDRGNQFKQEVSALA